MYISALDSVGSSKTANATTPRDIALNIMVENTGNAEPGQSTFALRLPGA